jgi:heme a synthase
VCYCHVQEPDKHYETPRVSPYRLAAHLASAFSIYGVLLWTTLSLAAPVPALAAATPAVQQAAARLRGAAAPLAALIAVTAASGKR